MSKLRPIFLVSTSLRRFNAESLEGGDVPHLCFTQEGKPLGQQYVSLEEDSQGVSEVTSYSVGGLGVTYSPRDPRFAGSNPTEVDGFFQDVMILSTSPPGGTLSWRSRV